MSSLRQSQIVYMNNQLQQLELNLSDMNKLINKTTLQFNKIKNFSKFQSSLFMSSHSIFEIENFKKVQKQKRQQKN